MNGKPGVLDTLEACGAYVDDAASFPEQFKPGVVKRHQRQYNEARATVERLAEALAELSRQHKNVRAAESYPTQNSAATDEADAALAAFRGDS